MSERPKHPKKELESVLLWAEAQGWRVTRGKGYYMMLVSVPRPAQAHCQAVAVQPPVPAGVGGLARALHLLGGGHVTTYRVRIGLQITATDENDDMDADTTRLMDELVALNEDADLGGSLVTGIFDVWVTVPAETPLQALQLGAVLVKTAAHAAGGNTSGLELPEDWPKWLHEVSLAADPVEPWAATTIA